MRSRVRLSKATRAAAAHPAPPIATACTKTRDTPLLGTAHLTGVGCRKWPQAGQTALMRPPLLSPYTYA